MENLHVNAHILYTMLSSSQSANDIKITLGIPAKNDTKK